MPSHYLHYILPHIKETFSDAIIDINRSHNRAVIDKLNHNFVLTIEDQKIHPDDSFGFVKLKAEIKNTKLGYDELVQFSAVMNHCHRGCHWAIDTMNSSENNLFVYATLITELGRRADDKQQVVMEILNLQKMKFMTEQHLLAYSTQNQWFNQFSETFGKTVIPCFAPENYLNPEDLNVYKKVLKHILDLGYTIQQMSSNCFKITSIKNTVSILTFLGEELMSLYSVVTEENKTSYNLKKILNEHNQDILFGHFEASPIQEIVGFTNYFRLADGLRDIKFRLFLDSPDFAKMIYFENRELAAS